MPHPITVYQLFMQLHCGSGTECKSPCYGLSACLIGQHEILQGVMATPLAPQTDKVQCL